MDSYWIIWVHHVLIRDREEEDRDKIRKTESQILGML